MAALCRSYTSHAEALDTVNAVLGAGIPGEGVRVLTGEPERDTHDPGENGTGTILQGFLEASNVDPVKELVTLIKTQRAFELNSQSIQTADQALQTIGNLRRF